MARIFKVFGSLLLICVVLAGGYLFAYKYVKFEHFNTSWRYKLTVEIDTPEGIKTGSAVREVQVKAYRPRFGKDRGETGAGGGNEFAKGEAVVIDLGERGQVFALLNTYSHGSDGWRYIVFEAFPPPKGIAPLDSAGIKYYANLAPKGPVPLGVPQYPVFVRFRDPKDPKSVENLMDIGRCPGTRGYPVKRCLKEDRLSEAFGVGVELKSISIEMTEEPVTIGAVVKYLPWLPERKGKRGTLGGGDSITSDPTGTWLNGSEFSRGVFW